MSEEPRQRIERVTGQRRARLTPAPGTDAEPTAVGPEATDPEATDPVKGPNDDRLIEDVPPHY